MISILFGIFGLVVLLGIAWLFSNNKKEVNWRVVASGVGLQLVFAILVILTPLGEKIFGAISPPIIIVSADIFTA